jgi:hypothetical protein
MSSGRSTPGSGICGRLPRGSRSRAEAHGARVSGDAQEATKGPIDLQDNRSTEDMEIPLKSMCAAPYYLLEAGCQMVIRGIYNRIYFTSITIRLYERANLRTLTAPMTEKK